MQDVEGLDRPKMTIRRARPDDLAALMQIEEEVFDGDRMSRDEFRQHLANPDSHTLVVDDRDGHPCAYALVSCDPEMTDAELDSLAVSERMKGFGLGSRLLERCERLARERGFMRLLLEVREDNAKAIALYRRSNFIPDGIEDDYYEDGMRALLFAKALTG